MTGFETVTIRRATSADANDLDRLAGLDSKPLPSDDFVLAEVDGDARAAIGVRTGTVVATPFHPTAELAELLRLRASSLRCSGGSKRAARRSLRRVVAAGAAPPRRLATIRPGPASAARNRGAESSP
jgi:hypothetical protein